MFDATLVREKYKRMTDLEITHLAQSEGLDITDDAFEILIEEIRARDFSSDFVKQLEEERLHKKNNAIQNQLREIEEETQREFDQRIWGVVFDMKMNAESDERILQALLQAGLDRENAMDVIASIESNATRLLSKAKEEITAASIWICVGLGISIISFGMASTSGGFYIITWGAVAYGLSKYFAASSSRSRYQEITEVIEKEKKMHAT